MPLARCPDCGDKVSTAAPACPHCGRPGPFADVAQGAWPSAPAGPAAPPSPSLAASPPAAEPLECPSCRTKAPHGTYCRRCDERLVPSRYLPRQSFPRVPVEFAGFGPRFGASLIDLGVLLPWILVSLWLHGMSPTAAAVSAVLGVIVTSGYQIGMHAWRGQTVGKAAMDIQVRNADGTTIGFEEAFIRYLPYLANAVISAFGTVLAASAVTETDFLLAGGWMERMRLVNEAEPFWTTFLTTLLGLFSLADVIVFFANRRRRALHDVMAGTVVVHV